MGNASCDHDAYLVVQEGRPYLVVAGVHPCQGEVGVRPCLA